MFKYLIPLCFVFTTACGDCDCQTHKKTKMSPNEHDHYRPVPVLTPTPYQPLPQKPAQYPKPVKPSPVQNPVQSPVQSPVQQAPTYPSQDTRYKCRCSNVETVCTADQLKDPRFGCYIVW